MPTEEQIKALEKVFDYIDKNEGITFAGGSGTSDSTTVAASLTLALGF